MTTTSIEAKNEEALAAYSTQWNALELELKTAKMDEKIKKVALGKFSELRKSITEDTSILICLSYSRFIGALADRTEKLASVVSDAKLEDALFGQSQKELAEKEGFSMPKKGAFTFGDILTALGNI